MAKADIIIRDGQEYVEWDDYQHALGLQLPPVRTMAFPSIGTFQPIMTMRQVKEEVSREGWSFGRKLFDSSWITNQDGFGSCASYGGSSALAKAIVLGGQPRTDLSGDYLYSLVNGGRDQGSMLDDNMRAITTKGVCKRETVPLGGVFRSKYNTEKADREALRFRAHEAYACPDEQSLATALALKMPVVIAIHVNRDWRKFDSDDILAPANGPGNHCEHLDDIKYSGKHGCFLYRKATSHGQSYSGDGYCWTTWDRHYKTTSRYHQFYAVPSAIQDPHGDKPFAKSKGDDTPIAAPKLTITTSAGCVWCTRWKQTEQPKVEEAGYELHEGSIPGSGVPRFLLEVGDRELIKVGFWSFDDIERAVANLR